MRTFLLSNRKVAMACSLFIGLAFQPAFATQSTFDVSLQAASCANCHGVDGRSSTIMPSIAGQPEALLREQLLAFKSQTPPAHTTVMNRLISGFSDEEIAALARHFSQINTTPTKKAP